VALSVTLLAVYGCCLARFVKDLCKPIVVLRYRACLLCGTNLSAWRVHVRALYSCGSMCAFVCSRACFFVRVYLRVCPVHVCLCMSVFTLVSVYVEDVA
jgi:hypothetical protein